MKLHITTYITFDLVPITLFLYYAHLVIRKLLNKSSLFIPDLLIEEQDKHQRLLMKKWRSTELSFDWYIWNIFHNFIFKELKVVTSSLFIPDPLTQEWE